MFGGFRAAFRDAKVSFRIVPVGFRVKSSVMFLRMPAFQSVAKTNQNKMPQCLKTFIVTIHETGCVCLYSEK